ncbi:hypothetical protein BT96DRAFT_711221 [Gymnopus androsaceus JB14]|uniref:Uncharacterized protein n=1 Tax=Gymnopus androsaceus JB14 TaxID=1447944 RepID=A0A6A4GER3_9AGAR|nr:hypothetical protein BT96DRAFT_711221 [Gymnopus androsaceus JB14]
MTSAVMYMNAIVHVRKQRTVPCWEISSHRRGTEAKTSLAFLFAVRFLSTSPIGSWLLLRQRFNAVGFFSNYLLGIGSRFHSDVISEYYSSYVTGSGSRAPSTPTSLRHFHMLRKVEVELCTLETFLAEKSSLPRVTELIHRLGPTNGHLFHLSSRSIYPSSVLHRTILEQRHLLR